MMLSMRMHNIALIEDLTLDFHNGLHVLTGETGAGKSIVVDAVNLVLGGRADRDLIRTGTDKAWVEAVFDAGEDAQVASLLASRQMEVEGGLITLYREISANGRNLCRVCGMVMPVSFLRELSVHLMDVHGQHEHQFLMDARMHMSFLDEAGDEAHQALLQKVATACAAFMTNHRQYAKLVRENERKQYHMEMLAKSLEELNKAKLKRGEEEALQQEKERYRHSEKITTAMQLAYSAISAGEDAEPVLTRLKVAADALKSLNGMGEVFQALASRCESAYYELQEVGYDLAAQLDRADYEPKRAEQVEARLDLIRRLERKYGENIDAILSHKEHLQEEYDNFASMDKQVAALGAEHKKLLGVYRALARELTESRKALAHQFEQRMMAQLSDLGMDKTVFEVRFAPKAEGKQLMPQPSGDDTLEFMISPNPGEPMKPLSKIASGGELSRMMLAIKSLEAEKGGVGCMVFDEIDTGISGRMAQVVAEKMVHIARTRQVICVTHLPQIAAMADHQYLVEKCVTSGRTNTAVRLLTEEERVGEVARMLGGALDSEESAHSHAKAMLTAGRTARAMPLKK